VLFPQYLTDQHQIFFETSGKGGLMSEQRLASEGGFGSGLREVVENDKCCFGIE